MKNSLKFLILQEKENNSNFLFLSKEKDVIENNNQEMDTTPEKEEEKMEILNGEEGEEGEEMDESNESNFVERAKYIPVRLSLKERKFLRLLRAAIKVNDYTDKVDQPNLTKSKRTYAQILEICSVLSGIAICVDYKMGQELVINRNLKDNSNFFQSVFELGRRHKVLNPGINFFFFIFFLSFIFVQKK
jgi:hypothetical protein